MAKLRPFRALRPAAGYEAAVAALPYDVYDETEARRETAGKPLSFLCIDRPETQFPEGTDPYSDAVYAHAAAQFRKEAEDGILIREDAPCYYVYALTMNGRTQTGLCGCLAVSDYLDGHCKKHENTVVKKEQDRIRHIEALRAQTGPIFLCYHKNERIRALIGAETARPTLYDVTSEDGVRHRIWRISDPETVRTLEILFAREVPCTYIADGHHRAASAVKAALAIRAEREQAQAAETLRRADAAEASEDSEAECDYFLSVLFPDDELKILDYNRVVRDLNGYDKAGFLARIGAEFTVEKIPEEALLDGVPRMIPEEKGLFHMYLSGNGSCKDQQAPRREASCRGSECEEAGNQAGWYRIRLKEEIRALRAKDPVLSLDVSALQDLLLAPVLGIGDPRTDERISFVGGIRGIGYLRDRADQCGGVAFSLCPTSIGELTAVADAGRLMPPKSTWFEPKLRSGFLIHELSEDTD